MDYVVRSGDTVFDVAYNVSGSLGAVDGVMERNGLPDYSGVLDTGRVLVYDGEVLNNAGSLRASVSAFNSSHIPEVLLDELIGGFVDVIELRERFTAVVLDGGVVVAYGGDGVVPVFKNVV